MSHEPVRAPLRGFRDRSYRWFTRRPLPRAHLVFSEERRFRLAEEDEWLPPPEVPLPDGVTVSARLEPEGVAIETDRPGHPLLVKISYHPRWKAEGADGPYLVSPGLMMVVPRQRLVRLRYGRDLSDWVGLVATLAALGYGVRLALSRRLLVPAPPQAADPAAVPVAPRRWGGVVPGALVVALAASRLAAGPGQRALRARVPGLRRRALLHRRRVRAPGPAGSAEGCPGPSASLPARREPAARGTAGGGRPRVRRGGARARRQPVPGPGPLGERPRPRRGRRARGRRRVA
jgi:hypothetical protein